MFITIHQKGNIFMKEKQKANAFVIPGTPKYEFVAVPIDASVG